MQLKQFERRADNAESEGASPSTPTIIYRGVLAMEANRAHNPEVEGSSPSSATIQILSGCGEAWLSRLIWDQKTAGPNPATPTMWPLSLTVRQHAVNVPASPIKVSSTLTVASINY